MRITTMLVSAACALCLQAQGGPLVGQWTLEGGTWVQTYDYQKQADIFSLAGPDVASPLIELLPAKLGQVVYMKPGLYENTYEGVILYLYSRGPWTGCAVPPEATPYYKVWFDSMVMTLHTPDELSGPMDVSFELTGNGDVIGMGPGFQVVVTITGSGTMYKDFSGKGALESSTITITGPVLDIKPGSEDNPVNVKSKGVLPVAVYGADPAVFTDPMLFTLAGVSPLKARLDDGIYLLKFDTQEVVANLGPVKDGQVVDVPLGYYNKALKSSEVLGCDAVTVLKKGDEAGASGHLQRR